LRIYWFPYIQFFLGYLYGFDVTVGEIMAECATLFHPTDWM